MQTASLIKATVKYPAQSPRETRNGPRINVVFTLPNGTEDKLWGNPDDPIQYLKKGEEIALIWDGKNYKLIATTEQPTPGAVAAATPATPPSREPHSPDVQEWVQLYREISAALPEASETTWRCACNNLFSIRAGFVRKKEDF